MIRNGKYIRINTPREAKVVFEYYEQFGIKPNALNLENCLEYPYLGIPRRDSRLLTGWGERDKEDIVSYQKWFESVFGVPDEVDVSQIAMELFAGV